MRQTKQRRPKESRLQTRASTTSSASVQPCSSASSWATWSIFGVVRNVSKENSTNSGRSALLAPAGRTKKTITYSSDQPKRCRHVKKPACQDRHTGFRKVLWCELRSAASVEILNESRQITDALDHIIGTGGIETLTCRFDLFGAFCFGQRRPVLRVQTDHGAA